jgi:hypothetical protein
MGSKQWAVSRQTEDGGERSEIRSQRTEDGGRRTGDRLWRGSALAGYERTM